MSSKRIILFNQSSTHLHPVTPLPLKWDDPNFLQNYFGVRSIFCGNYMMSTVGINDMLYSLYIHCMITTCSLYVHYMFIICSLYAHHICIRCLLYIHYRWQCPIFRKLTSCTNISWHDKITWQYYAVHSRDKWHVNLWLGISLEAFRKPPNFYYIKASRHMVGM